MHNINGSFIYPHNGYVNICISWDCHSSSSPLSFGVVFTFIFPLTCLFLWHEVNLSPHHPKAWGFAADGVMDALGILPIHLLLGSVTAQPPGPGSLLGSNPASGLCLPVLPSSAGVFSRNWKWMHVPMLPCVEQRILLPRPCQSSHCGGWGRGGQSRKRGGEMHLLGPIRQSHLKRTKHLPVLYPLDVEVQGICLGATSKELQQELGGLFSKQVLQL